MKIKKCGVHNERLIQDCTMISYKYSYNISKPVKKFGEIIFMIRNDVQPQTSYWALLRACIQ